MSVWFLAVLALVWASVLVPAAVRARVNNPLPAVQRFKRAMGIIAPSSRARRAPRVSGSGRWVVVPREISQPEQHRHVRSVRMARERVHKRRLKFLITLLAFAAFTGVLALLRHGNFVEVHLIADAALVFYIAFLLEDKRRREETAVKVRRLPRVEDQPVQEPPRVEVIL